MAMSYAGNFLLLLAALPMPVANAIIGVPPPYDKQYTGDATYYGVTPDGDGNCAIRAPLPAMYEGMIPVALADDEYEDSAMCGACIEGEGSGNGSGHDPVTGPFKAYVTDRCPECSSGDLDFAADGDGRWEINWHFVPCDDGDDLTYIFEGSNEFYWKIQPRGGKAPVEKLWVNDQRATRTMDNFFEIENGPYNGEQVVKTKTVLKQRKKSTVALS